MTKKGRPFKSGSVTVTVDYGYDSHSITFSGRTYGRICAGKGVTIKGQGFHWDGDPDQDYWHFNGSEPGSLNVDTEGGGVIYSGSVSDGEVWIEGKDDGQISRFPLFGRT